jgi:hypothetical protein
VIRIARRRDAQANDSTEFLEDHCRGSGKPELESGAITGILSHV